MKTELEKAINILQTALKSDPGYKIGWVANIAMAYIDSEHWYKQKIGKKYLNKEDKHIIANNAAENFIRNLCMNQKNSNENVYPDINTLIELTEQEKIDRLNGKDTQLEDCNDWNQAPLEDQIEFLEEKYKFDSSAEAFCVYNLIDFYRKSVSTNKTNIL